MSLYPLNLSQQQIAQSEQVNSNTPINTISVCLTLPTVPADTVARAADAVLRSGDIFAMRLVTDTSPWQMDVGDAPISPCRCTEQMHPEQAQAYMERSDRTPLVPQVALYCAEAIPLTTGGSLLYVRFHHIIIDGYGMSLFAQRVLDVLTAPDVLPSPSFFAPNAATPVTEDDAPFWLSHFEGADFHAAIFPERAEGTQLHSLTQAAPAALCDAVHAFSRAHDLTPAYVFAAAYALYLADATGKPDAVISMPRLNRAPAQRELLGCFTLLVPVRIPVRGEGLDDSFLALCQRVTAAARDAADHKSFGYHRIVSALRENNVINESLTEYVFNYYRHHFTAALPHHVTYSVAGGMRNHLTFNLFNNADGSIDLRLDGHATVYTPERCHHVFDALCSILSQGVAGCSTRQISILGAKEQAQLFSVCGRSYPVEDELTIPSLFRRVARQFPERPALYAGEVALTFAELDAVSDRIARALVASGVKEGDCIAYMLNRDWRILPTMLGISKSGAAFIPVDPAYPADRVSYILENSGAVHLVSSANVSSLGERDYLEVDALIRFSDLTLSLPAVRQEQLAYMIYTSGTTGRPKGVMLSHRGIANITHPDNNPFNRDIVKNGHGIVAIGSVCFDISLFEMLVPLFNGLFVEFGNEKSMIDAAELAAHVTRHNADILHCTPSRLAAYLSTPVFAEALQGVKAILAAGEVLPASLVNELKTTYGIRVYNGYGPTETTIGATITEDGDMLSIGAPIANMGVLVLNPQGKLIPYGASGEICVYGEGVGLGYRNRPEETAAKYVQLHGKRLYRTGDVGYLLPDGRLIYQGRNDRQIKLRGLRIELSEIEKVLGNIAGVAACCCMVRKLEGTEHLVGFYTVTAGNTLSPDALREEMRAKLTAYMVPDVLKELPLMPQTPGGKTDLRALQQEPITYTRTYHPPLTPREITTCDVFARILGCDRIGLEDNFFELGGTSLTAVSLLTELEERLNLNTGEIDFGDLYKFPTPALLLDKIYGTRTEDEGYALSSQDYRGIDEYLAAHNNGAPVKRSLGTVLLTGATGYLGVHLLIDLLSRPELCDHVVCLARPKRTLTAEKRVKNTLFYYDAGDLLADYGDRWSVVEGDITEPEVLTSLCDRHIDTIINSAANVAHFAYGDTLEKINTDGVRNIIRLALAQNAALCQISTISVGGVTTPAQAAQMTFDEHAFYVGQQIHNQYIYSKFMAEYALLRAAVDDGLAIKLLRVGNLQGRIRDGEFQMNMHSNAFTRRLSSYIKIGMVPRSVYEGSVNFSPVDETAHIINTLAATADNTVAFNIYPPAEVPFRSLFETLEQIGHHVEVMDDEQFAAAIRQRKRTREGKEQLEGLYTAGGEGDLVDVPVVQDHTNRVIAALGDDWSPITPEYLHRYLLTLDEMEMFSL